MRPAASSNPATGAGGRTKQKHGGCCSAYTCCCRPYINSMVPFETYCCFTSTALDFATAIENCQTAVPVPLDDPFPSLLPVVFAAFLFLSPLFFCCLLKIVARNRSNSIRPGWTLQPHLRDRRADGQNIRRNRQLDGPLHGQRQHQLSGVCVCVRAYVRTLRFLLCTVTCVFFRVSGKKCVLIELRVFYVRMTKCVFYSFDFGRPTCGRRC